jgi:hypothetical protein
MNFSTLFFLWIKELTDETMLVGCYVLASGQPLTHSFVAVEILHIYSKQYFVTGSQDWATGLWVWTIEVSGLDFRQG